MRRRRAMLRGTFGLTWGVTAAIAPSIKPVTGQCCPIIGPLDYPGSNAMSLSAPLTSSARTVKDGVKGAFECLQI